MKKLLALLVVPAVLVFLPGCPSATTPAAPTTKPTPTTTPPTTTTPAKETTTDGKVTKHEGDKLTIKDDKDKEHTFMIKEAKIMLGDKEGKASDLKDGEMVKVTAKGEAASKVEIKKEAEKPKETKTEGTFVSYKDDKLTIKVDDKPKDFTVKDIKPTSDGKDIKWDDFKEKDKVTVMELEGKVTKVEKAK